MHHGCKAWLPFAAALGATALLCAANSEGWAEESTSSVQDGIYTDAQAARGAAAYPQHCAACHGASLGGLGEAPALIGAQFIADFNGLTVGDLFDRIRTTMPLNNPSGLSRDQYADILSFILKSNGYPAGPKELNRRSEFLNAIRFEAPAEGAGSR
jgi:mono/diheme cytochrome c family protein